MTTLISHLRRKPVALLGLLLQIPLFVLSAPPGLSTAVHLTRDSEKAHPVGALYFMTNNPEGNAIVAGQVQSDGSVIFRNDTVYRTGGNGSHVNSTDLQSPDALRSQGAIAVSNSAQVLATVNAGSNTVSLFNISDTSAPWNISLINEPVGSFGGFPVSVAFNKLGTMAYVLNSGATNGVTCYNVSKEGGLTPIPGSDRRISGIAQTDPPTLTKEMPTQIMLTDDGKKLLVSVSGVSDSEPGFLSGWLVDENGLLSNSSFPRISLAAPGYSPSSFAEIPNADALLVTDPTYGLEMLNIADLSHYERNFSAFPAAMENTTVSRLSFSKNIGNFYLIDSLNGDVIEVVTNETLTDTVLGSTSLCTSCAPLDSDIAEVNGTDFLYVLDAKNVAVIVVQLVESGNATFINSFNATSAGLSENSTNIQGLATFMSP